MSRGITFFTLLVFCIGSASGEHQYPVHGLMQHVPQKRSGFLGAVDEARLRGELHRAISDALGGKDMYSGHLAAVRAALTPTWQSLAKNDNDRVDRRSLNYVVQRYMLSNHHLSIIGFEHVAPANQTSTEEGREASIMEQAPRMVKHIVDGNISTTGFSLDDAVAMTVMLEELLSQAGNQLLKKIYNKRSLDVHKPLSGDECQRLVESYLMHWLLSDGSGGYDLSQPDNMLADSFDDWPTLKAFVKGRIRQFERNPPAGSKWNPMRGVFDFADASWIVRGMTMSFGDFWRSECDNVRTSLLRLDYTSTGRVKLADFHGAALNGEWRFSESKEYLRQLGALDETSTMLGPRIIVANYLQGASNCIVADTQYRVCCASDCEHILAEIENAVVAPTASPEQLISIISNITTGLDDEKVKLTPALKSQLDVIANGHGGLIPVHGRLFSQWLHYVFPRDCPFPHKSGTVASLSPMQYGEYMASETEIRQHAKQGNLHFNETTQDEWVSHWSHEEELLSANLKAPWQARGVAFTASLFAGILLAAAGVFGFIGGQRSDDTKHWTVKTFGKEHLV